MINLFASFELIKRVGKGCYTWNGVDNMRSKLEKVSLSESEILGTDSPTAYSPSESLFDSEAEDELSNSMRHSEKSSKEKSLGTLACQFIRLLKIHGSIAIERAAEILSQNLPHKYKTKVPLSITQIRRLYDVSKVLVTIGLIRQTYDHKRSTLEWTGLASMASTLTHMVESSFARLNFNSEKKLSSFNSQFKKWGSSVSTCDSLGKRSCRDVIDLLEAEDLISKESFKL